MPQKTGSSEDIVAFLRRRDYRMVCELGQGACGKTALLYDEQIDEHFVCKKYVPYSEGHRQELFAAFVRQVKLLHKVLHQNVVRVFNYYLYPEQLTGYILMEHVNGLDIDDHLGQNPEHTNDMFLQAISGFGYLERAGILHRDIRPANLMVREDGMLKIIDLGFGRRLSAPLTLTKASRSIGGASHRWSSRRRAMISIQKCTSSGSWLSGLSKTTRLRTSSISIPFRQCASAIPNQLFPGSLPGSGAELRPMEFISASTSGLIVCGYQFSRSSPSELAVLFTRAIAELKEASR